MSDCTEGKCQHISIDACGLLVERDALAKQLDQARAECEEQARLLGKSGSKEAKLLAELGQLRAEVERMRKVLEKIVHEDTLESERLYIAREALSPHHESKTSTEPKAGAEKDV